MRVVDSCGWLEHLRGSAHGGLYGPALADPTGLLVPTICIAEVYRVLSRSHGEADTLETLASMRRGVVAVLDPLLAVEAGRAGLAHALPLADSIIYATARRHAAELWTHDAHFRGLPGVRFVEAPAEA